jgi:hypothetical protein
MSTRTQARQLDILIDGHVGAAIAHHTRPLGAAARHAQAWAETLHNRTRIRAERSHRSRP